MQWTAKISIALVTVATLFGMSGTPAAKAQEKKPNIVVIMGDDIGMWNIGAYHRGLMAGRTPNLDRLASFCRESQNNRIKTGVRAFSPVDFLFFSFFS